MDDPVEKARVGDGPKESIARLFAVGLKRVALRRARGAGAVARMGVMILALGGAGVVSMAVGLMLGSAMLLLGASPLMAALFCLNQSPAPGAQERIVALALAGAASWALVPLWLKGCDKIAGWIGASPLNAEQLAVINGADGAWFKRAIERWFEGKAAFGRGVEQAVDAAIMSKMKALPTGRAMAWLAAAPLAAGALALCVGPWMIARMAQSGGGVALRAARSVIAAVRRAGAKAASPLASARGAREWARGKAIELAREGAGTEEAARAQKADLERALGPSTERASQPAKRL